MNLSDLLDVELYNDSLKMFNQAQEGTLVALENVGFSHNQTVTLRFRCV